MDLVHFREPSTAKTGVRQPFLAVALQSATLPQTKWQSDRLLSMCVSLTLAGGGVGIAALCLTDLLLREESE